MDLSRPVLGSAETRGIALECIKEAAHLLPKYIELVHAAIARLEGNTGKKVAYEIADLLQSVVASILQGSNEYGQHRGFINNRWSAAYVLLLEKEREGAPTTNDSE